MPSRDLRVPDSRLAAIAGRWRTSGHVVGESPIPIRGTDTYEVFSGGYFLVHHVDVMVGDQRVRAIEIIGERDGEGFLARSFDGEGNVEVMQLTVDDAGVFHFSGGGDVALCQPGRCGNCPRTFNAHCRSGGANDVRAVGALCGWYDLAALDEHYVRALQLTVSAGPPLRRSPLIAERSTQRRR